MNTFLEITAPVAGIVSGVILMMGFFPPLQRSKAYHFLSGESAFVTTGLYAAFVVEGANSFAPFFLIFWFATGSAKFATAIWGGE